MKPLRMIEQFGWIVIFFSIIFSVYSNNIIYRFNTDYLQYECFRLVRNPVELTPEQERLKKILDHPTARIEDVKLLVGGILDELIKINPRYEEKYKKKARAILIRIHKEVKAERRSSFPRGIWKGGEKGQGFINAVILIRNAIDEEFDIEDLENLEERLPPDKGWGVWLRKIKLERTVTNFGINNLIKETLATELYPNKKEEPHLHEWKIIDKIDWHSKEGRDLIKQAVSHILIDHMGLTLDETFIGKIKNWKEWAEENGLLGMFARFNFNGREMLKYVFPDKFYNYRNPSQPHVWHDWDFHIHDWDTEEGDKIAYHFIRHKLFDPQHGEGWLIEGLANRVNSWDEWAREDSKFGSMVRNKFGAILPALKFGLDEEFAQGILRLSDFQFYYGYGVAKLESPLKELKLVGGEVNTFIGEVSYGFGVKYKGYWVNKLSEDLGGLWRQEDGIYNLINVFPLRDWGGPSTLYIPNTGELLRPVPEEYATYLTDIEKAPIPEETAKQILTDEFGIVIRDLNIRELVRLIAYLNVRGREVLRSFLNRAEPFGITVLGNIGELRIAEGLVGAFDKWMISFMQYSQIHNRIDKFSDAFGLQAKRIREGEINPSDIPEIGKHGPILLSEAVENSFMWMNNMIMESLYENRDKFRRIKKLITAQEKLLLLSQVLEAFRNEELEPIRQRTHPDGAEEYWFKFKMGRIEKQVRLVTRPYASDEGDAGISFTIEPYSDEEIGFRIELGIEEIKGERRNVAHINIDLRRFTPLLDHLYMLKEEHELKLANPDIFSWLVRMVY